MATIIFGAVGASLGSSVLGGVFGAAIGGAVGRLGGALLGNAIDSRLFGDDQSGGQTSARNHPDSLKITTAFHGAPVPDIYGRTRLGGHVIWADTPETIENGNSVQYVTSFAIALCAGVVHRLGRVWINGEEASLEEINYSFYDGSNGQTPDPIIQAREGEGATPAYRGIAYLVVDGFDLAPFGGRIPNIEFEVFRQPKTQITAEAANFIRGINIIPGSGEYVYGRTVVDNDEGMGIAQSVNRNTRSSVTDYAVSIDQATKDLPNLRTASLVVSWFGDDLRCEHCTVSPRVENDKMTNTMTWRSGGIERADARHVNQLDGAPVYGGTPSDQCVVDALRDLRARGLETVYYPFILMDIPSKNTQPDPYSDGQSQPVNPWRGRITLGIAPGRDGSPDKTIAAEQAVANFIGNAKRSDFSIDSERIVYSGDHNDWGYRRFILHQAMLCQLAGGVDSFLIGSELRGMTQIRGIDEEFPFVAALRDLADDVRAILPDAKISYGADWSEFRGYAPAHENDAFIFHLDPLWADDNIDYIGIDNYMPLSDWRHNEAHLDEAAGTVYALDYLMDNVEGGEGYDWYYANDVDRLAQRRTPITDGENEPWIWRYKDIRNWWSQPHFDRPNGLRETARTAWVEQSKPIVFCEYGAATIDLATNQPNKFIDKNSSESAMPYFSHGDVDGFIPIQYITAMNQYWGKGNNPTSPLYDGRMIDMDRACYWCWDARPWPEFPAKTDIWSDGGNFARGHWLNGRINDCRLANIVASICEEVGVRDYDVSKLYGVVPSVVFTGSESAAEKLGRLMMIFDFRAFIRDATLTFVSDGAEPVVALTASECVEISSLNVVRTESRRANDEPTAIELSYADINDSYAASAVHYAAPEHVGSNRTELNLAMGLDRETARQLAEKLLRQSAHALERVHLQLPLMRHDLDLGMRIILPDIKADKSFIIDKLTFSNVIEVEAYHVPKIIRARGTDTTASQIDVGGRVYRNVPWLEVFDLGLTENPQLRIGVSARPWGGMASFALDGQAVGGRLTPDPIGQLRSFLAVGAPHRRQNAEIEIELTNGKIDGSVIDGFSKPMIVIRNASGEEIIGFDDFTLLGAYRYRLTGLYRGLRDTPILNHNNGATVMVLDNAQLCLNAARFGNRSTATLGYGFVGGARAERAIAQPNAGNIPMCPSLHKRRNQFFITPRWRQDFDAFADGKPAFENLKQSYRLSFFEDENPISILETSETEFEPPVNANRFTLRAISQLGHESHIKEVIIS